MRRLVTLLAALVCSSAALSACGSVRAKKASAHTSTSTSTSTTSTSTSTTAPTPTTEEATSPPQRRTLSRLTVVHRDIGGAPATIVKPVVAHPRGLVIYVHGSTDDENTFITHETRVPLTEEIVGAGYEMASSRAGGDAWGNPASVAAYQALADALRTETATPATFILAESMGGVAGLLLVANHGIPDLKGFVGISAVTDLRVFLVRPDERDSVRAAFGGGDPPASSNPIQRPPSEFAGVPLRLYASPGDTDVLIAKNTNPFAARLRSVPGTDVTVVPCQGNHGNGSCSRAVAIRTWFDSRRG